ncbi:hypothetical protein CSUI_002290 [Cystoisospora suis]|uniref:Uncharacterized protein n=1 Tax=Cystoisospora suis TaxID=483139 RepID=A0A2C6L8N5_9APIC|nr:hypothetical protein CSUI_002290 [Cystoisospora suis]
MTNGRRARGVGVLSAVSSGDTARRFQDWAIAQAFYGEALRKARGRREKSTVYARIASLFLDSSSDPDLIAALEKRQHLLPRLERKSNRFASFSASQRRKAGETSKAKGEPHPEIWDGGGSRASAVATLNNEGEERGAHDDVARTHSRSGDKTVFSKSTGGHRDSDITLQEPLSFSFNRWRGPPVSPSSVEFSSSHSSSAFCSSSSSPRNATGNPLFASSSLRAKQKASSLPRHGSSQVHSSPPLEEERQEQKDCFIDNFSSLACRRGQDGFSNLQGGPNPSTTKGDTFLMFKAREYAVKSLRCNPSNFVGLYVSAMAEGLSCRWCSASVVALSSLNLLSRGRLFKRHSRELLFRYYPWTSPRNRLCSVSPSSSSFTGERCRQNLSSSFSSFLSSSDGSFSSPNGAQLSPLTSSSFSRLLPLSFRRGFLPSHVFVSSSLFAALSRAVHLKQKRKWRFLYSLPSAYNHTSLQRDSGKGENALGPSCTSERTTAADDFTCLRGVDEFQGGEGIQDQTSFFYHSSDRSPLRFPTMRKFCLSNSSSAGRLCSLFNSRNGSMIRHVYGDLKLLHMRSSLMAGYPMECLYSLCDFLYVMETTQWKRPETTDTSGLFTPCLLKLRSHTTEGKPSENVSLSAAACEGKEPTERGEETLLNSSWSNWILQAIFLGVQAVCEVQRVVVSKAHQCEREENRKLSSAAGGPFFTLDWKLCVFLSFWMK